MTQPQQLYEFLLATAHNTLSVCCVTAIDRPNILEPSLVYRMRHASANNLDRYRHLGFSELYYYCTILCRAAVTDEFVTSHTISEIRKLVLDPANLHALAQSLFPPNSGSAHAFLAYLGCLSFESEERCSRFMESVFKPLGDALAERSEQFRIRLGQGGIPQRFLDQAAENDPYGVGIALLRRHHRHRYDAAQEQSKPGTFENDYETYKLLLHIEATQHPLQLSAPLISSTQATILTTHKKSILGSQSSSPSRSLASRFSGPSAILKSSSQEKENSEPSRTLLSRLSSPHTSRRFRQRPY
ncbi:hypothetical protein C8R46DRAFT_1224886 [Mycena filopes]|nr:hypothetical protein C8R46DRAFT_1224886 [Mycena filopes]